MKLHYFKPPDGTSNFGDELNVHIWKHFLPNFFDDNDNRVFFGIGTILRAAKKYYPNSEIIVFGAGAHGVDQKPNLNFQTIFVRGPLSSALLNNSKFITDPAILTPIVFPFNNPIKKHSYSYIPHFSVANHSYKRAVERLGINYIDPRSSVDSIIEDINASKVLICEAMHGAIVADSYRIPWIPVSSFESFNNFKWKDWSQSLSLSIEINKLHRLYNYSSLKESIKNKLFVFQLKKILKTKPYLSDSKVSAVAKEKILEEVSLFKEKFSN